MRNITIFRDAVLAIFVELVSLLLTPFVPLVVLFRRKSGVTTTHTIYGGESVEELTIERKQLPKLLWWWQTPDERLPGGMYEPTVKNWYIQWGDYVCSVLWLLRNRLYGLSWAFGRPAERYLDPIEGRVVRDGRLWRYQKRIGRFTFGIGWKVHHRNFEAHWRDGPLWAIPFFSIKRR